jgi:UDPglucose--hexose-1-phosphate uridylyltransferase
LQDALGRVHRVLGDVAYNVVVNTAPRDDDRPFHWWVDIVPRVGVIGGFEMGSGVMVNPVEPQTAAAMLLDA